MCKRILALLLCLLLLLSLFPATVLAEGDAEEEEEIIASILDARGEADPADESEDEPAGEADEPENEPEDELPIAPPEDESAEDLTEDWPAEEDSELPEDEPGDGPEESEADSEPQDTNSGECGDDLRWSYDEETATLTISGTGEMWNYYYHNDYDFNIPWYRLPFTTLVVEEGCTAIGDHAFQSCKLLSSTSLPESLKEIGIYAFSGCNSLASVELPEGVDTIHRSAFASSSLTSISLPPSLRAIEEDVFYMCGKLRSVDFPEGLRTIGTSAFGYCRALTYVDFPEGLLTIGTSAFSSCSSLTAVTIPKSLTSVGHDAFKPCNALEAVYISDLAAWCGISFSSEGSNPLYYAHKLYLNGELVTDLVIPAEITEIGQDAFVFGTSITSVTVPEGLVCVGMDAFKQCSALNAVYISNLAAWCGILFESRMANPLDCAHNLYLNGDLIIDLVIPESATDIGNLAFSGASSIRSVSLPNSLRSIGGAAFYGCSALSAVYVSDLSAWCGISFGKTASNPLEIAHDLYLNGELVTDLVIPDEVSEIGTYAFSGCSANTVTLPEHLSALCKGAFRDCVSLREIILPAELSSIGTQAFYGCTSLREIILPAELSSIGTQAFYGCTSLREIILPAELSSIETEAFYGCTSLREIEIPAGLASIGRWAFGGCIGLNPITFLCAAPELDTGCFEDVLATVYYPDDGTWTEEKRNNYGGFLTWVPIGGEAPETDGIPIDADYFPDLEFCRYIRNQCDMDKNCYLTDTEISAVTSFFFSGDHSIRSVEGINIFTAMTSFVFFEGELTSLDLSGCTELTRVNCENNKISSLNLSGCAALNELECSGNMLTSLDLSGYTALNELECGDNQLTSLDLSGCAALREILCNGNRLSELDVHDCVILYTLDCGGNQLHALDVSRNTSLLRVFCSDNRLTELNLRNNPMLEQLRCGKNQLTSLDLSKNTNMRELDCVHNRLTALDLRKTRNLSILDCQNNALTSLDVKANSRINKLNCSNNLLGSLDLSACPEICELYCSGNELSALKVGMLKKLNSLDCSENHLTALDIRSNTGLRRLYCQGNCLSFLDLSQSSLYALWCFDNEITKLDLSNSDALLKAMSNNEAKRREGYPESAIFFGDDLAVDDDTYYVWYGHVAGQNRYETSLYCAELLRQSVFGVGQFDNIVVAYGGNFADALGGSYLAIAKHAPILLVDEYRVDLMRSYIQQYLKPNGTVYLLGGTGVVPAEMQKGFRVKRLAGANRFGTNLAILKEVGVPDNYPILVCSAYGFADSLSASASGAPILLVGDTLRPEQKEWLGSLEGTHDFVLIGGEAAVKPGIAAECAAYGDVYRVGGKNRYETSSLVAESFFRDPDMMLLAYGENFPDGLCASPIAYYLGAPLLLVTSYRVKEAAAYAAENNITEALAFGGPSLISDDAIRKILY